MTSVARRSSFVFLFAAFVFLACGDDDTSAPPSVANGEPNNDNRSKTDGSSDGTNDEGSDDAGSNAGDAQGSDGGVSPTGPDGVSCETTANQFCANCGGCTAGSTAWEGAFNVCRHTPCQAGFIACWIAQCDAQKCTQHCM